LPSAACRFSLSLFIQKTEKYYLGFEAVGNRFAVRQLFRQMLGTYGYGGSLSASSETMPTGNRVSLDDLVKGDQIHDKQQVVTI